MLCLRGFLVSGMLTKSSLTTLPQCWVTEPLRSSPYFIAFDNPDNLATCCILISVFEVDRDVGRRAVGELAEGVPARGARQGSCRLIYAARG